MSPRKSSLKEVIILAAQQVFSRRGLHGATVDEISREAGCSSSAVYKHFKNKQELHQIIRKRYEDEMIKIVSERLPFEVSLTDHLRWSMGRISAYFEDKTAIFRTAMVDESMADEFFQARSRVTAPLLKVFEEAVERRELRGDIDPHALVLHLGGMYNLWALNSIFRRQEMPNQEEIDGIIDVFLNGVCAKKG